MSKDHPFASLDLTSFKVLGSGTSYLERISALITENPVFAGFSEIEIEKFAAEMQVFKINEGQPFIREGDPGNFIVMILDGKVEIFKKSGQKQKFVAIAGPGKTIGEMSLIDDEPRFATCRTAEPTTLAILERRALAHIMQSEPLLGAKIMMYLAKLLNQRLRRITTRLLEFMG